MRKRVLFVLFLPLLIIFCYNALSLAATEMHAHTSQQIPKAQRHFLAQIEAIKNNNVDELEQLLAFQQLPSLKDKYGHTLLMVAVRMSQPNDKIVQLLLNSGSNPNTQDDTTLTPLMVAAMGNHEKIVEILLMNGANTEIRDEDGYTALMKAVMYADCPIVRMLISKGADVNATSAEGITPLMLSNIRNTDILLLAGADVNAIDGEGNTAIIHSVLRGYPSKIPMIFEAGAKIDVRNFSKETALMVAVKMKFNSAIETLRLYGAKE